MRPSSFSITIPIEDACRDGEAELVHFQIWADELIQEGKVSVRTKFFNPHVRGALDSEDAEDKFPVVVFANIPVAFQVLERDRCVELFHGRYDLRVCERIESIEESMFQAGIVLVSEV